MSRSASLKMVVPNVKIQRGIMKNAENVDTAVIVTDRSKFPPNITVHILDAPPPGEAPYIFKEKLVKKSFSTLNHVKKVHSTLKIGSLRFELRIFYSFDLKTNFSILNNYFKQTS